MVAGVLGAMVWPVLAFAVSIGQGETRCIKTFGGDVRWKSTLEMFPTRMVCVARADPTAERFPLTSPFTTFVVSGVLVVCVAAFVMGLFIVGVGVRDAVVHSRRWI